MVERALGEADHLGADRDAAFVQRLDGNPVALSDVAEHVRGWHHALVEEQLAGAAGADAELVFLFSDGEAGESSFDHECGDAAVAGVRIRIGEHDEEGRFGRVADPQFAAGEHPLGASGLRARRQGERIAAGRRLRERIGADRSRRHRRQVPALEVVGGPPEQGVADERVLHVHEDADRRVHARNRFDSQHRLHEGAAHAAVRFGDLDRHDAEVEQQRDQVLVEGGPLVHLPHAWPYLTVGEGINGVPEQPLVVGQNRQREVWNGCVLCGHASDINKGPLGQEGGSKIEP